MNYTIVNEARELAGWNAESEAGGDPDWDKKEAYYTKEIRLMERLKRGAELVIVADIHHLANASQQFNILLSVFQTDRMMPLLMKTIAEQSSRLMILGCSGCNSSNQVASSSR
jgi:hypothetical protein